jgi:hypothetical protein
MMTSEGSKCGTSGYVYNTDASATSLEGSTGAWLYWGGSSWDTDETYTVTCLDQTGSAYYYYYGSGDDDDYAWAPCDIVVSLFLFDIMSKLGKTKVIH